MKNNKSVQSWFDPVFADERDKRLILKLDNDMKKYCARRQDFIVSEINRKFGKNFVKDSPVGSEVDGFRVCAYDDANSLILMTFDTVAAMDKFMETIQEACNHFADRGYTVCVYVIEAGEVYPFKEEEPEKELV